MHQWWTELSVDGCGVLILSKKVYFLRKRLCHWAKYSFGSIKLRKLPILYDLEKLDIAKESRRLSLLKARHEQELQGQLKDIRKQEEVY